MRCPSINFSRPAALNHSAIPPRETERSRARRMLCAVRRERATCGGRSASRTVSWRVDRLLRHPMELVQSSYPDRSEVTRPEAIRLDARRFPRMAIGDTGHTRRRPRRSSPRRPSPTPGFVRRSLDLTRDSRRAHSARRREGSVVPRAGRCARQQPALAGALDLTLGRDLLHQAAPGTEA